MFKELLYPLVDRFTFFNIFQYISFRAAYAALTSLFVSFVFGPRVIEWLRVLKFGQSIRSDGPQSHQVKAGTPTMGGVLIIISVVISLLLWQDYRNFYTWLAFGSILGFGILGFLDDFLKITRRNSKGLRAWFKFAGQILVSLILVGFLYFKDHALTTLLYVPFIKDPVIDLSLAYIPLGIFLLVGFSNAVNLTDGLDGLATGLMIIALLAFGIISYLTGHADFAAYLRIPYIAGSGELAVVVLSFLGACVGFLWFNCHPAEIMMGDTGSLTMGGLLGVMSLMLKKELLLIIIGGVFVIETASVIIQVISFKSTGKRVFRMSPLHHHFELSGWAESKVVARFWILGGMFAILALSTLKLQ
jgi:phospho-N-acetylmuramoyl-pentapeptide-transferase